jgi:Protein of unknown function (DUF1997)
MQSHSTDYSSIENSDRLLHVVARSGAASYPFTEDSDRTVMEPTQFRSHFVDCMEMNADVSTVAEYLDAHPIWFRRCAQPMKVEPIGQTGYALVIGRFGSFGYEVEPKVGLDLLPQEAGVYRIETIPVPGYEAGGYDVDFQAAMKLVAAQPEDTCVDNGFTKVQWQLDLTVTIQFPRFIHTLPKALIQSTGDRLLHQVVRQVSSRLTHKVQTDFHSSLGLALPKRSRKWFFQKSETEGDCVNLNLDTDD